VATQWLSRARVEGRIRTARGELTGYTSEVIAVEQALLHVQTDADDES
jgi:hypothetical protein